MSGVAINDKQGIGQIIDKIALVQGALAPPAARRINVAIRMTNIVSHSLSKEPLFFVIQNIYETQLF